MDLIDKRLKCLQNYGTMLLVNFEKRGESAMGKKAKKKNNKWHLRPPLSFLDKSIYLLGIILSVLVPLLLGLRFPDILEMIAFRNPETVAYKSSASILLAFPFLLFLETSAMILFIVGWQSKKPIFGNKKYRYGEYPFREDCFPLFSSRKRKKPQTPSQKRFARNMKILWCSALIVFSCMVPFSFYGRNAMYQDNHIEKINLINHVSDTYTENDFARLTIQTEYVHGHRGADYWKLEMIIEMKDGKAFSFSNKNFSGRLGGSMNLCLNKMLEIKELFSPAAITIQGAESIGEVSDYFKLDAQQVAKLEQLFTQ